MCLADPVAASWSLTQEVAGVNPFTVMTNIFVTEFSQFKGKNLGKTEMLYHSANLNAVVGSSLN